MKKLWLSLMATVIGIAAANAEGYQVNTLSAKQNGMGHTGTALKLGAESQIFNPAGMGWLDKSLEISASVSPIFSTVKATLPDGSTFKTDNKASTPMSINAAFSVYDNFKAGVTFYTPYGSGINWNDNWPGAVLNQSVKLQMFTVQPTFTWRILPNLSVGAGLMVTWGTVDLNKGLVSPQSFDVLTGLLGQLGQLPTDFPKMGTTTPASVNLNGSAHPVVGINAGIMYDINEQWTVGLSYRSKMTMTVEAGTASLRFANKAAQQVLESSLGVLDRSEFKAAMPAAAVYNIGVSYKPITNLVIAFDAQLTGWSAYKQLDIEFADKQLSGFDQHIEKNYRNSWTFHLGAQYNVTPRFDARIGLMLDTTPCNKNHYNPETPGMTKIEPSCGFSFRPLKNLSIDMGFLYVAGLGAKDRVGHYEDFIAKTLKQLTGKDLLPLNAELKADYKVSAFCPSIGVTLSF